MFERATTDTITKAWIYLGRYSQQVSFDTSDRLILQIHKHQSLHKQ